MSQRHSTKHTTRKQIKSLKARLAKLETSPEVKFKDYHSSNTASTSWTQTEMFTCSRGTTTENRIGNDVNVKYISLKVLLSKVDSTQAMRVLLVYFPDKIDTAGTSPDIDDVLQNSDLTTGFAGMISPKKVSSDFRYKVLMDEFVSFDSDDDAFRILNYFKKYDTVGRKIEFEGTNTTPQTGRYILF